MNGKVVLMLVVFGLMAFAVAEEGTTEKPPCPCPSIYSPVCGADGNTYSNKCVAECNNVEVVSDGDCPPPPA